MITLRIVLGASHDGIEVRGVSLVGDPLDDFANEIQLGIYGTFPSVTDLLALGRLHGLTAEIKVESE